MAEIKYVTLDEFIADVKDKESRMAEPQEVGADIYATACEIVSVAESDGRVCILTDYDADGICSAYIMEKTMKAINPDLDIEVVCNDRRGSYGVPKDIEGEEGTRYIVLDMGSNELDYIHHVFGQDTIVIDHHLIESDANREAFNSSPYLLNPHSKNKNDSLNAQYCATGLAYRIFECAKGECEKKGYVMLSGEKLNNTLVAMASLGTVADVVNLMDMHSRNREIVKRGIEAIDNANETNFDFVIGHILAMCDIPEQTVSKDLGYNVGAFLNSASRMSAVIQENGAMRMYNAITASADNADTFFELEALSKINSERKRLINELQTAEYYETVKAERASEGNIFVYVLPEDTPHTFAGLMAGRLSDATDKAVICLTLNTKTHMYSGSGRNADGNSSLMDFLDEHIGGMDIVYGGHHDAIGISAITEDKVTDFISAIYENRTAITRNDQEITLLALDKADISSAETLAKLEQLEPIGSGLKLPPVEIRGVETYANSRIKGNEHWKNMQVSKCKLKVADWNYDADNYPMNNNKEISFLAEISIKNFNGRFVGCEVRVDRAYDAHIREEIQKSMGDKEKTASKAKTDMESR